MGAATAPRRKRHVFRWFFLAVQVGFLAWIIGAVASNASGQGASVHAQALQYCAGTGWYPLFRSYADCVIHYGNGLNTASDVGTTIGVGLVIGLWVAADVILGLTWLVFVRPSWSKYERQQLAAELAAHTSPYQPAVQNTDITSPGFGGITGTAHAPRE
jgi:hypothetical protein